MKNHSGLWLAGGMLLIAIMALHLWSLLRFPHPFLDEVWLVGRAWGYIQTGQPVGPLDRGILDRFPGYWTYNECLIPFLNSFILRLWGEPHLWPMRLMSLCWGVLLLGAIYAIASHLGGLRLGLLSVVLVAVSGPFFFSAHMARYDIATAALGFAAVALYLRGRGNFWPGVLAGLSIGVAFEIHANGVIYAPVVLALFLWHKRRSILRCRGFWGLVIGGVLGAGLYAVLHIIPYPQTFFALNRIFFGATRTPPLLSFDPQVMLQAVGELGQMLVRIYRPALVLLLVALVVLSVRRSPADQTLLVLVVVLVISYTALVRNKFVYYAILITPALDLLMAALILECSRSPWRGRLQDYASRILVWGLTAGFIGANLMMLGTDYWQIYQSVQSRINQVIQPGDSIMAVETYWLGLYDHVYYSWELLPKYRHYRPGSTLEDALREFRPDVLIIDGQMRAFIIDPDPHGDPYRQYLQITPAELDRFLARQARLLTAFDGGDYGPVSVYRLDWETPAMERASSSE